MAKYLGNAGLSYLWSKFKNNLYNLKSNELSGSNPDSTYTYTATTESATAITVNIITQHTSTTDTLICTLSQAVDVNLLFRINLSSSKRRFFTVLAGNSSVTFQESSSTVPSDMSIQLITSVALVEDSLLASKYTFTINTPLLQNSTFEHILYLNSAAVDWHANTISGTLTRSTTAGTKPAINTYIGFSRWEMGEVTYYRTSSQSSISSSSNNATLSAVPFIQTTAPINTGGVIPISPTFSGSAAGHYITAQERSYSNLIADVGITVNNFSQTSLQPKLVWYRSSGACAYKGTLPTAIMSFTGLVSGDQITIKMYVHYSPNSSSSGSPYTVFSYTKYFSSGGSASSQVISFSTLINSYVGIDSNDFAWTNRIYMDAYLTNSAKNISSQYIGSWPTATTSNYYGAFTKTFSRPADSTRPVSTNTSLFGMVTLDGQLW